jgi:hypothetical protein
VIDLDVKVVGVERVVANLGARHGRYHAGIRRVVDRLTIELQRAIQQNHHDAGGLNLRRGGPGSSGVAETVTDDGQSIRGRVSNNVWYVREWELNGMPAHDVVPVKKRALMWPGAAHPVRRVSIGKQEPRPTFRPALVAMGDHIRTEIAAAVAAATRGA